MARSGIKKGVFTRAGNELDLSKKFEFFLNCVTVSHENFENSVKISMLFFQKWLMLLEPYLEKIIKSE